MDLHPVCVDIAIVSFGYSLQSVLESCTPSFTCEGHKLFLILRKRRLGQVGLGEALRLLGRRKLFLLYFFTCEEDRLPLDLFRFRMLRY